jgi:hypothetical protein
MKLRLFIKHFFKRLFLPKDIFDLRGIDRHIRQKNISITKYFAEKVNVEAKEKAKELIDKMYKIHSGSASEITLYFAKESALVLVNEILDNFGTLTEGKQHYAAYYTIEFYKDVKQEIENYNA